MRSCEEFELLINLYLDDMLPSEETRPLKEHLKECQACRERYRQFSALKAALGDLDEPAPEGLHGRILDYVEKNCPESAPTVSAAPASFRPRRWCRVLAGVAACAVIAVASARYVPEFFSGMLASAQDSMMKQESLAGSSASSSEDEAYTENLTTADTASGEQYKFQEAPTEMQMNSTLTNNMTDPGEPAGTGQMAEDLPPLRQVEPDMVTSDSDLSVCKWLRAEGRREDLPDWVDLNYLYETDMDGETVSYVEIAVWAEEQWTDQLTACGFTVEEMAGENLTADGDYLLLFFFWN